jgi:hypothetical protein
VVSARVQVGRRRCKTISTTRCALSFSAAGLHILHHRVVPVVVEVEVVTVTGGGSEYCSGRGVCLVLYFAHRQPTLAPPPPPLSLVSPLVARRTLHGAV